MDRSIARTPGIPLEHPAGARADRLAESWHDAVSPHLAVGYALPGAKARWPGADRLDRRTCRLREVHDGGGHPGPARSGHTFGAAACGGGAGENLGGIAA